jgi:hypothetical protein
VELAIKNVHPPFGTRALRGAWEGANVKPWATRVVRITAIVIGSIVGLVAVLAAYNGIATGRERVHYPPPGMMVEVRGKRMHVYSVGQGRANIVLLSGLGSPGPALDFGPLVDALKGSFRVSVVEYFGYGWSDQTDLPRTNRNIVEETRRALTGAGIAPPYVLVPHSLSGF